MSPSQRTSDVQIESPVQYGTTAFSRSVEALMNTADQRPGTCIVFQGGLREERQQALAPFTEQATGNVHQFRVPSLLGEYRMQTQNSLRKAFDHAAEEQALLYFDTVDALFRHSHSDAPDHPEEHAAPTTVEYFFDRVVAYTGLVVLAMQRARHVRWLQDQIHLVVRFA